MDSSKNFGSSSLEFQRVVINFFIALTQPLHPEEIAKRHKFVQLELMMRSGVVGHISKRRHVLIAMYKEKSKEEDHVP